MSRRTLNRLVLLFFFCCSLVGGFADTDAVKSVSATEGDSVTLHIKCTEIQKNELIMWNFKTKGPLIAKLDRTTKNIIINGSVLGGRFRDRLILDDETGSLTIIDTRTTDTGVYEITISSSKTETMYRFNVTVYARLPVPVIISQFPQNSSSGSSNCSVVCSAVNVSHVTLSWLKGNSLFSSISVSELNNSVSLHLECLDESYSCVVNNTISNQTTRLQSELCQPCEDCRFCCSVFEAVTRLVVSALVGVAAVVIVVYDVFTS